MKKYIAMFSAVLLITLISGCFYTSEDYLIRYEQFLNYSLGEFEIVIDGEIESWDVSPKTWKVWELQYTHQSGEVRDFRFTNLSSNFGRIVLHHAILNTGYEIEREIARQYFEDEELVEIVVLQSDFYNIQAVSQISLLQIMGRNRTGGSRTDVINRRNGLRLYAITPQELVSNWNVTFGISVFIRDNEIYEYMIDQTKEMVRTLSAYLEQDQVEVFFRFRDWDFDGEIPFEDFHLIYSRETDNFEVVSD